MQKQVVVVGLGRFGVSVATTLHSIGHDVLAIDRDETRIQNISAQLTHAIQADATNEAVLKELEIKNFDVGIVAMGSDIESSVLSTILLKKLGVRRVIARANDELHGSILEKIGADSVVYPEREMGERVAHRVTLSDVSDYMSIIGRYGMIQLDAPPTFIGQTLATLGFGPKGKWEIGVLLILRKKEVIVNPALEEVVEANDTLVLAGNDDKIEKLLNETKKTQEQNG
ncbi:MAG: TrkA family potassium uptake protein [Chloroflexota bacterium]